MSGDQLTAQMQRFINFIGSGRTKRAIEGIEAFRSGKTIPAAGATGYPKGFVFNHNTAVLGQATNWINLGSEVSALFVPFGPVNGYGFIKGGGPFDCTNGSTTTTVQEGNVIATDLMYVGHSLSDDNDQVQGIVTALKNYGLITGSADPLVAHDYVYGFLRNRCTPEWDIVAAGSHTTVGGAAAEAITVTGALAGDIALVVYGGTDDTDVIRQAVVTADTLTVTCSADPLVAHIIHYVILRPRGSFRPSHYVAYAGSQASAGGDATEVITITGALATDVPIVTYQVSDDADSILKAVLTANTLTLTCSADPTAAAKTYNYMILRAY